MTGAEITVELGSRSYDIVIGDGIYGELPEVKSGSKRLFVFDDRTFELYSKLFACQGEVFSFGRGEADKRFDKMVGICRAAIRAGLDRSGELVAVGGGVTGDMTGFAAGIFQRGIAFIQMPTTLLAMVDSSVGGKTAVDLPEGKNLLGLFYQPRKVVIDTGFLRTLPDRELRCGMAEVIKMAAAFDVKFFEQLENAGEKLARVETFLPEAVPVIARCCGLKADVVRRDETESRSGVRELLNSGHTFGHAIEILSNFSLLHGECVAIGMVLAGRAALKRNMWSLVEQQRLENLLKSAGLPTAVPRGMDFEAALQLMRRDKKNRQGAITLILPRRLGELTVFRDFSDSELREIWQEGAEA